MADKFTLFVMAVILFFFGVIKILFPESVLKMRDRYSWLSALDIYGFLYKSKYAAVVVRVNGFILVLAGLFVIYCLWRRE